jgi:hypothetical protein
MSGRTCNVPFFDLLGLIACAQDYGHTNDVCMSTLMEWVGLISDQDIADYTAWLLEDPRYGDEDAEQNAERLTAWRDKYQRKENPDATPY